MRSPVGTPAAFAVATALSGWLLHWGVGTVIAFGVLLHVVSLVVGIVLAGLALGLTAAAGTASAGPRKLGVK